jgi:hypothetical protein
VARSKAWRGLSYRPLERPAEQAAALFRFAGAWAPSAPDAGWGAWDGERLVGAALIERVGATAMVHGPVVVAGEPGVPDAPSAGSSAPEPGADPLEIAEQILADILAYAGSAGVDTVFTRPQGLDRLWVRSGFIPVPEVELPADLRGRPGAGLFGWRGGTALWSAAGRGAPARAAAAR